MVKKEAIKKQGVIIEGLPNASFKVKLDDDSEVLAPVEISPYDKTKGRIVYREK
jgi:translation initiation factor IF-1